MGLPVSGSRLRQALLSALSTLIVVFSSSSWVQANSLQSTLSFSVASPQRVVSADFNGDGVPDVIIADGTCGSSPLYPFFGQANGTFNAGTPFGTPSNPCAISGLAAADLNGDGKQDVVTVDAGTFGLQIYLNNGNGTFTPKVPIALGNTPGQVVIGDFDGDGIPDLVIEIPGNANDSFEFFHGNGDGTVAAPLTVGGATTSCTQSGTIAVDLNHDGKLDLVTACTELGEVIVLLGNGNGTFQAEQTFLASAGAFAVAAADFNRDGNVDVVAYGNAGLDFLQGNGNGTFKAPVAVSGFEAINPGGGDLKVLDIDGDGIPDLVVSDLADQLIAVIRGRGDGTFLLTPGIFPTGGPGPGPLAVLDVNADGIPDVVVTHSTDADLFLGTKVTPLFQNPIPDPGSTADWLALGDINNDGTIDAVTLSSLSNQFFAYLNNGFGGLVNSTPGVAAGSVAEHVVLGDLNGDGKLDAVSTDAASNKVDVFLGNGDGTFQTVQTFAAGSLPLGVALADFNHDGKLDVVVTDNTGNTVSVLLGNGTGGLQAAQTFAVGNSPFGVTVADFNHDGNSDLAVTNQVDQTVSILLGKGDGTFQAQKTFSAVGDPLAIAVGDFNGDGIPDLAVAGSNSIAVFLGNGDGTFTAKGTPYSANLGQAQSIQAADLDGDGILDLVFSISQNTIVGFYHGNGDGTFQTSPQFFSAGSPLLGTHTEFVGVADVNNDGLPDLVVAANGGGPSVLLNNGNAGGSGQVTYQPKVDFSAGTTPAGLAIADFNGDGKDDVAVANSGSANVSVLFGNGSAAPIFGTAANFSTGAGTTPIAIAAGDFNHDGWPDLAVTNDNAAANGTVIILLNDKTGKFGAIAHTYTVGMHPRAISAVDVDGDGNLDLEVTNGGDGTISVLFGNGDGSFQTPVTVAAALLPKVMPAISSSASPLAGAPIQTLNGMATADLNGDGKPDMVAADSTTSSVQVRLNQGSRTFASAVSYLSGGTSTASIALGDVNGDGKPDIVAANYGTSNITVFLGKGDGTFTTGQTFSVTNAGKGKGPFDIQLLDFNGDGRLDVVTVNYDDSTVSALAGNGNGTFQAPVIYSVQLNPQAIRHAQAGGSRSGLVTSASNGLISVLLPAVNTTVSSKSSQNPSPIGQSVTITATVTPASGAVVPTGTVTFSQSGIPLAGPVAMSAGKASLAISTLPGGSNSILMSYSGDLVNNPSSNTATQEVVSGASTTALAVSGSQTAGATLTLTATVSGAGATPTGGVTFKDGATVLGSVLLSLGSASIQTSKLAIGPHNLQAFYNGDESYSASASIIVPVDIQPTVVAVEITSSNQVVVQGTSVTFTAAVTANGSIPTGTVDFVDGATTLATKTLNGAGKAAFTTTTLTVGQHTIQANYNGDLGVATDGVIQIVYSSTVTATTTALTSTALLPQNLVFLRNHALPGTPGAVKFTATITCTGQTPGGTVQFYDDDTLLTPVAVAVSASKAAFTYNQLTIGLHNIIAVYSGDSNCGGSVIKKNFNRDPKPLSLH